MLANEILKEAANTIDNRASERDTDTERSMTSCVNAFNAMFGTELTEQQGWQFMVLLKMSRAKGGDFKLDDYLDMAAYAALAGESAAGVTEQKSNLDVFLNSEFTESNGSYVSIDMAMGHYLKWCTSHNVPAECNSDEEFIDALNRYHACDDFKILNVELKNPL